MLGTPTRHGLELNKTHVVDDIAKEVEVDTMSLCPQQLLLPKSFWSSPVVGFFYEILFEIWAGLGRLGSFEFVNILYRQFKLAHF